MTQTAAERREKDRARKASYGRDCLGCGARTDGSNGRAKAPLYCKRCESERRRVWTAGAIVLAIQVYAHRYGQPPAALDWNTGQARDHGHPEIAERFLADGDYPQTNTVQRLFGSWNAAIAAAGFEPRPIGVRGPERPRA